jgi:elongation factor Tu
MGIDDVFKIAGRGIVVTGRIELGRLQVGDDVEIIGIRPTRQAKVIGIEMARKLLEEAAAEDEVGVLLRGPTEDEVERGQVLARPASIESRANFTLAVHMLPTEEGGSTRPIVDGERLRFWIRTVDVTGTVRIADRAGAIPPGKDAAVAVTLTVPMAVAEGQRIAIRRDDTTIGDGTVLE